MLFFCTFDIITIGDSMEDTFVTKDKFGLDVVCRVLGTFEIEGKANKYVAYTDYIYDEDMHYNVYFSEIVMDNDIYKLEEVHDEKLLKTLHEMYQEGANNEDR
jgi:hypothetical protein